MKKKKKKLITPELVAEITFKNMRVKHLEILLIITKLIIMNYVGY